MGNLGWKTMTAGIGMMVSAVIGGVLGFVGFESEMSLGLIAALTLFLNGLGFIGVRVALPKLLGK